MARGWESKSVEAQQAEANDQRSQARPKLSKEEAIRQREIEGLRLSMQRILQQLAGTQNPRHRSVLERALADLNEKMSRM
jgi:hypothetical protein